jgi:Zn-finger protein
MAKSIIQEESEKACYLCGSVINLQKHHVWHGTGNRKIADKDGLFVWLCESCHRNLHDKNIKDRYLMEIGEKAWLDHTGKTINDFISRYGKNVL